MRIVKIALLASLTAALPDANAAQDLLQIYDLAVASDPKLKQSEASLAATGETDDQSIARLLPVLTATGTGSWNRIDNKKTKTYQGSGVQEYWNNTATLSLTQPVFHWDYWVQLSQSENQIAQAEADYQAAKQDLMLRVVQAYFDVLSAQDTFDYNKAATEAYAKELEQAKQRFEVGLIPATDVYQAQSSYDQSLAQQMSSANDIDSKKEALREIVGDINIDLQPLRADFKLKPPDPTNIDTWSKLADAQSLSVISELNAVEISRKDVELQRSGHYPKLDLTGSLMYTDNNSSYGMRGDTEMVGLTLTVPIYSGGSINSKTQQAEYELEEAKEKLNEVRRSVNRDVKDAYRNIVTSISQAEAYKSSVLSSEKALEATRAGYEVGTETMVDVLDMTDDLYKAKSDLSDARYDFLVNTVKLKEASSAMMLEDMEDLNKLLKP